MNDYSVSDYGIFQDAIGTTNKLNGKISIAKSATANVKNIINNESIFMGPIAESCVSAIESLTTSMQNMRSDFNAISTYLTQASAAYQQGDTEASNVVANLTTGTISATASGHVAASEYANPRGLSGSNLDFINSIKDGAVEAYNEYGVLPSLTLAQAILESGWGKNSIGNNVFGIKAGSSWTGKTQDCRTSEQTADGRSYSITATFRDYDSVSDSIVDHARVLTQDFYQPVIDATNYTEACKAVKACGYATAVDYDTALINIIETYGLDQWDPK